MMERDATLADLFERLDRERVEADRRYNDALTALDRALQDPARSQLASPPALHDASQVERLNQNWKVTPEGAADGDRSPKGRLRGFIWRVVGPALEAQERFNAAIVDHVNRNISAQTQAQKAAEALVDAARREIAALERFEWLLLQFLQTITGYVDTKDRSAGGPDLRAQVALVQQRLAMVERQFSREDDRPPSPRAAQTATAPAPRDDIAAATYLGFEDRFRGASSAIRERLTPYLPLFTGASNVLDIGCGRGELLELLREHGVSARGIDANQAMVDECRARGLDVEKADAVAFLEEQPDASLGGLSAVQVAEHCEPAYLARLLTLAYLKLRPGAPLVLETINPACWMAFFETYIRDLTHVRPLHPDTLRYLVQASGFSAVNVEYRAPVAEADRLDRVSSTPDASPAVLALAAAVNAHADKLNARLFSSMDYAIIARR